MAKSKKKKPRKHSKANVDTIVRAPLTVEKLIVPNQGMIFTVGFSIMIPEGTNNFHDMSDVVDEEINGARNQVLKKVAQHLGADVNFED